MADKDDRAEEFAHATDYPAERKLLGIELAKIVNPRRSSAAKVEKLFRQRRLSRRSAKARIRATSKIAG